MGFGNLGLSELLVLAVLVLVFFGPRRIPEIARSVGGALREFRRGWNEIRRELDDLDREVSGDDRRRRGGARPGPERGRVEPGDWGRGEDGDGDPGRSEDPPRERPGDEMVPGDADVPDPEEKDAGG